MLALRLIVGDKYAIDLAAREYFVSRVGAAGNEGNDNIARVDAALTWRITGKHAVSLKYVLSRRDASYFKKSATDPNTRGTIGLYYTLLWPAMTASAPSTSGRDVAGAGIRLLACIPRTWRRTAAPARSRFTGCVHPHSRMTHGTLFG